MSRFKLRPERQEFYFCTITCYNWLPLIKITQVSDIIYKWFYILIEKKCYLTGYVIMPNHLHLLLYQDQDSPVLNKLIANGKRFLSYEIINRLKIQKLNKLEYFLHKSVCESENKKGKKHNVFQPSFDLKVCEDEKMIETILDYIHFNPASKKWNLVKDYTLYEHSSAGFYESVNSTKFKGLIHYKNILNGNIAL